MSLIYRTGENHQTPYFLITKIKINNKSIKM